MGRFAARRPPALLAALAVTVLTAGACGAGPAPRAASPSSSTPAVTAPATPAPGSTATASSAPSPPSPSAASPSLCGQHPGAPEVDKVMVIWEENHSYSAIIGSSQAPYINLVAGACGLGTSYEAATHPSLPNYLTPTSGLSYARPPFDGDCSPGGSCLATGQSIFGQEVAAGHQWRGYAESMPAPCDKTTAGSYAARHNPAVYYPAVAADCARWDVAAGTPQAGALRSDVTSGDLPAYSTLTPDVNHDMHNGTVKEGDRWLSQWLPVITAGPDYRAGRLAIVIVWDEGGGFGDRPSHVPLIVLSASTRPGTRVPAALGEYSLLRTCEQLTGIGTYLGGAASAPSFAGDFNL